MSAGKLFDICEELTGLDLISCIVVTIIIHRGIFLQRGEIYHTEQFCFRLIQLTQITLYY